MPWYLAVAAVLAVMVVSMYVQHRLDVNGASARAKLTARCIANGATVAAVVNAFGIMNPAQLVLSAGIGAAVVIADDRGRRKATTT